MSRIEPTPEGDVIAHVHDDNGQGDCMGCVLVTREAALYPDVRDALIAAHPNAPISQALEFLVQSQDNG